MDADIYGPSLPSLVPSSVAEKVYASEQGGVVARGAFELQTSGSG